MKLLKPLLNYFKQFTKPYNHPTCLKKRTFVKKFTTMTYAKNSIRNQCGSIWNKMQYND